MVNAQVSLQDSSGNVLCFKHAVQRVIEKEEDIKIEVEVQESIPDSYDSGFGIFPGICVEC